MSATFNNNDYTTPPSTPRRFLAHEAYFPPRSHLVGLGLDFEFPPQSSIVTGELEQCSAPRLGSFSSPYEFGNGNGNDDEETRCASYWSADSSVSTASQRLRRLRSESEIEEDEMMENRTCASSSLSTSASSSKFAYSPFAGAAISPSPRVSDTFSTEVFGLGLSLHDEEEEEEDNQVQVSMAENENDAWSRQTAWSFECLESPRLPYADADEDYGRPNIDREDIFGFKPAPSYSYALTHTSFSLLPAANIPTSSSHKFPSLSSGSPLPSILKSRALSSSSSSLATSLEGSSADDLLIQSSKFGNVTGDDPFSAKYNAIGERKRKRKESSIVASPAPAGSSSSSKTRSGGEESENVKRLKSSPALKHLGIFTHAAILEEREQVEKQARFADALSGLSVDMSNQHCAHNQEGGRPTSLSPSYPTILLEPTPELGSPSPSPSMRTVDCTLLLSNMPSESPYPPTPSSSAFAPFVYSSTIESMASPSSSTFQEEVKKDICHKLSLSNMGISVNDVNVFPSLKKTSTIPRSEVSSGERAKSPRCDARAETSDRRGMVVVVHTA